VPSCTFPHLLRNAAHLPPNHAQRRQGHGEVCRRSNWWRRGRARGPGLGRPSLPVSLPVLAARASTGHATQRPATSVGVVGVSLTDQNSSSPMLTSCVSPPAAPNPSCRHSEPIPRRRCPALGGSRFRFYCRRWHSL
jgi:hypothetical protein